MARRSKEAILADNRAVLGFLSQRSETQPTCTSAAAVAAGAGLSESQTRRALQALRHTGLIESHACFLPNGGQTENAYEVTKEGVEYLTRPH